MALNSNFRTLTADNIEGVVSTRNYLRNSFENGALAGWTELSVALTNGLPTGTPTISSTAASSLGLSVTSTTPLSLDKSLLVTVPSALTAGQGFISDAFTLDRMDLGKVITVSFDYERVSGTYNFSGTLGSQTWMVYIYDATAGGANWIQPAGFLGMNQSSGPGRVSCTFQSSVVAGQQYRIAVIASQAAAGASSIEFDNFSCSRQTAPIGPVVTDWASYTPTGSWTVNTTYSGKWRRVGDSIEVDVNVSLSGAPNATTLSINLPSGYSIDTSKISTNVSTLFGIGQGISGGSGYNFQAGNITTTSFTPIYQSNVSGAQSVVTQAAPVAWGSGNTIHMRASFPLSGASSNVQLSNDTDTRVVAFSAYDGGGVAVTNTTSLLPMGTTEVDTHSVRSGNTYVVPVSGFYRLAAKSTTRFSVANTAFNHALLFYKNGAVQNNGDYGNADGANSSGVEFFFLSINSIVRLNAGDVIDFRYFTNYTGVATTYLKYCSIERLSGPSVVAASETVAARYGKTATQSFSAETKLTGYTRVFDTHAAWDSSNNWYRFPVSGKYLIEIQTNAITGSNGAQVTAYRINGGVISYYLGTDSSISVQARFGGSTVINVNAGDYIEFYHFTNVSTTVQPNEQNTHFTITRLGN